MKITDQIEITERIASDVECMRDYFASLFTFAEASIERSSLNDTAGVQFLHGGIAHFVRPDMVCNIYSLVDFWLAQLCIYYQERGVLIEKFETFSKELKKKKYSELQIYDCYLTSVVKLDLSAVRDSFNSIDSLRKVRNIFIHNGGHAPENKFQDISAIPNISIQAPLIIVTDQFVWHSLEAANRYLQCIAEACGSSC